MANKLYEENSIRAIADRLRRFAPYSTYTVSQMADGVEGACQAQYEMGRDSGFAEGELSGVNKVKTEEARTGADVVTIVEVPNRNVEVSVTGGYYANETVVNVDVQPVYYDGYNLGYDDGHSDGYDDGFAAGVESGGGGGGGESSDVDEMIFLGEDRHDEYMQWGDETPFYSLYKWVNYDISTLSSSPVIVTAINNHETKYMHLYIYAYTTNDDEELYETLVIPPSNEENGWWSTNSLEIEYPCYDVRIWGIRWSDDGV